jgi:hypothetical protein
VVGESRLSGFMQPVVEDPEAVSTRCKSTLYVLIEGRGVSSACLDSGALCANANSWVGILVTLRMPVVSNRRKRV